MVLAPTFIVTVIKKLSPSFKHPRQPRRPSNSIYYGGRAWLGKGIGSSGLAGAAEDRGGGSATFVRGGAAGRAGTSLPQFIVFMAEVVTVGNKCSQEC